MADIKDIMKNSKYSSVEPKPKTTVRGWEWHNKETGEYDNTLPKKGGVDQGVNKSASDDYDALRKVIGADEGAKIKTMKKGGRTSASKRADGIATKGHTKGRYL